MRNTAIGVAMSLAFIAPTTTLAQTSPLYLTDYDTPGSYVVQGGVLIHTFNRQSSQDGPAFAIHDTIKMVGQDAGSSGREYDYDGNLLSGSYLNPGYASLYDGATDGVHNWSIAHNDFDTDFAVVQGDTDWNDLQVLFVPQRRSSGITYDANTGTFWISNNSGGTDRVQQYSLAGDLLSEFDAFHSGGGYGIAWDPADDTLWIPGAFGTATQLFQYDKTGVLLQSIAVSGLPDSILGAEFLGSFEPGFSLATSGDCPGTMTLTASGAEPRSRIYFIYGFSLGSGPGVPGCPGLNVGILSPVIAGMEIADANGEASFSGNVPQAGCGRVSVQAVDRDGCQVSEVVGL